MRAMRLEQPAQAETHPLVLTGVPRPQVNPESICIRVQYCGVCHTDLHMVEGEITPAQLPITPGHQIVGEVEQVGSAVTHLEIGDRVGVPWFYSACGRCDHCRRGFENLCSEAEFTGFTLDGGFADYAAANANFVLRIPDEISSVQAAPLLCAGIIGYRSLRKADLQPGERLGLFGFGASAHLAIQVARFWGCEVYVFTRSQAHREHARALGAAWVGGADDFPPKPLDRAVIFAPAGEIVPKALEKLRPAGTLAINAIYMSDIPKMPYPLIYGERTLRSVANATYRDGVEFLEIAVRIPICSTVTEYPLHEANRAILDVKHSRLNGEAVLRIAE